MEALEAATPPRGRLVGDLAEADRGLVLAREGADVRGQPVLEVVRLTHERDRPDAIGVADRNPEIALLDLQLAAAEDVELHGRDAQVPRLAPGGAVATRVLHDDLHPPPPGGAVVAQQVVHVAPQERHLGWQGGRGEQFDRHEIGQTADDPFRRRGEREGPPGSEIEPPADAPAEQVHHDQARREQHDAQPQPLERRAAGGELAAHQRKIGEQEEQRRPLREQRRWQRTPQEGAAEDPDRREQQRRRTHDGQ